MQKQFCLITEPWIKAVDQNGKVKEYGLSDALTNAENIRCLAGELPNQDFAVLRLLLAVMQTVVYRYDNMSGRKLSIASPQDALSRWEQIWRSGHLPKEAIENYFSEWEDRFYLMHPKFPFYQIPEQIPGKPGTSISPGRMIGAVGESDNKARFFSTYSTSGKNGISNTELTRWIIHFQAYDTKATKNSKGPLEEGQEKPHPRIAWCGNLGAVFAEGDNLFETLMLNLVLLHTDTETDTCFAPPKPSWERDFPETSEDHILKDVDNQAELLSIQGRRLFLNRGKDAFSATAVVGENLDPKNAFIEQMTLWRPIYLKSKEGPVMDGFTPSITDYTRESVPDRTNFGHGIWNRFSRMMSEESDARMPGIVLWIKKLTDIGILPVEKEITIRGVDTVYHKTQGSAVMDVKGNAVDMRLQLLSHRGDEWREMLDKVVSLTNDVAELYATFYKEANEATGHSYRGDTFGTRAEGAEQFYEAIDAPFRKWLSDVNDHMLLPDEPDITPHTYRKKWEVVMFRALDRCAKEKVRICQMQSVQIVPAENAPDSYTGLASAYDKLWFTIRKYLECGLDEIYWNMRPKSDRGEMVRDYVLHKINIYKMHSGDSDIVKELLRLRKSFGEPMEEHKELLGEVLSDFPPEYRSDYNYTRAERAVFTALSFYAFNAFRNENTHVDDVSFGRAIRKAAFDTDTWREDPDMLKRLVKYMNYILSAESLNELMMYIKLLSKLIGADKMTFNYGLFAHNLFTFQIEDYSPATRMTWAADFLRLKKEEKQEETEEKPKKKTARKKKEKNI